MQNKIINGVNYFFDKKKKIVFYKKNIYSTRNDKKFKIGVIIDTAMSIPPTAGVPYRLYYLSRALAKRGYKQVWFLGNRNFIDKDSLNNLKNNYIKIYVLPPKLFYNAQYLNNVIKKEKIDILQYEITQTFLQLGTELQELNDLPVVLENHDIEASLRTTLGIENEVDYTHFMQFTANQLANISIVMTPLDKQILKDDIGIPEKKIVLAPNGIDEEFFSKRINKKENILIFLGNIFYPPNQKGLIYCIEKVFPYVKKEVKDVKLKVIGMTPVNILRKYKNKSDIIFCGEIKDNKKFCNELLSSSIGLCIVFAGSGMKVKILNYCASGLPVVSTTIGSSGYENMSSLIIEDEEKELAKVIIKLLKDRRLAQKIGQKNKCDIIKNFHWNNIANKIIDAYNLAHNIKNNSGYIKKEIPLPFWMREQRANKKTLNKYYVINKNKIYEPNKKN